MATRTRTSRLVLKAAARAAVTGLVLLTASQASRGQSTGTISATGSSQGGTCASAKSGADLAGNTAVIITRQSRPNADIRLQISGCNCIQDNYPDGKAGLWTCTATWSISFNDRK
jgi:hypothetical protein